MDEWEGDFGKMSKDEMNQMFMKKKKSLEKKMERGFAGRRCNDKKMPLAVQLHF